MDDKEDDDNNSGTTTQAGIQNLRNSYWYISAIINNKLITKPI